MRHPRDWRVYLVTDRTDTAGRDLLDVIGRALAGGVGAVQLRERDLAGRDLLELARRLRDLTARHGAALLVNDRVDVALACGADGVHLPGHSFRIGDARALLGPERLIGVSAHTCADVVAAGDSGADFAVFGPVYDTPSKRAYGSPVGLAALREAASRVSLPVLAIGGITSERVREVRQHGAAGVAAIRALLQASDPERTARELAGL